MFRTYRFESLKEAKECFETLFEESKALGFIDVPACGEKYHPWMVKHDRPEDIVRIIKWTITKNVVQIWEDTESHERNAIIEWEDDGLEYLLLLGKAVRLGRKLKEGNKNGKK